MEQALKSFRIHLRRAFVLPLIVAAVLGGTFVLQTYLLRSSMKQVEDTFTLQLHSRRLLGLILNMETGVRGFLLTGDDEFLQPYREAEPAVEGQLRLLSSQFGEEPQLQTSLNHIRSSYHAWHIYSQRMIQMRRRGEAVNSSALNMEGKRMMDEIRRERDVIVGHEEDQLSQALAGVSRNTITIFATAMGLSLLLGLALARFASRELTAVGHTYREALEISRKREEELAANREWLATILGSIGDGVIATDREGRVVFANEIARRVFAIDGVSEVRKLSELGRLVSEFSRVPLEHPVDRVLATGKPAALEGQALLIRPDGIEIPIAKTATPILDSTGIRGAVMVVRDLSEQRRSEAALRSSEKLANMGRLAASVAHEIHNPLDALGNLLYLLEHNSKLDPQSREYVRLAAAELERASSISEQMLTFSREARKPVRIDVCEILDGVLRLYQERIQRLAVKLVKRYDSAPQVMALPGELRQVFSNLVGNALDAMPSGGVLTIHVTRAIQSGKESVRGVRVFICDTGLGIPEELRPRLAEPFVTSKGEKGTGLGLWVSRGIVQKYQGSVRFRSSTRAEKSGTCFSVFLPSAPVADSLAPLEARQVG